ncbi:MAG: hypothetical protein ACXAAH_10215 [Promethearchaeota archaeon]|jgi:DNA-directed RNA polymerase subunit RPC12/RpoP
MEKLKERKQVNLAKTNLIGGMIFIIIGLFSLSLSFVFFNSMLSSLRAMAGAITWTFIATFLLFGIFYFYWGFFKLRKIFHKISNKVGIYFSAFSIIILIPVIFYGFTSSVLCIPMYPVITVCLWRPSGLQILFISLGFTLLIFSFGFLIYEIIKIKGDHFERYLEEQMKIRKIAPISEVLYMVRIDELGGDLVQSNYVCGKCGEKNKFEGLNDELKLLQCLNCGSKNYLAE